MAQLKPVWTARVTRGKLEVSGSATRYPNDFSTAGLEREPDDPSRPELLVYRVVFHRDKEPFCDTDLIGPVAHYERSAPAGKTRIRIVAAEGTFEVPIAS